jgi:periplasmic protein CpxP/Spy
MSSFTHPIINTAPLLRSVAIAALLGATFLASPLTAAYAQTATNAPVRLVADKSQAATDATAMKAETVEQRIDSLHTALKITPDEETKWTGVAQAMRDNATAMQKLVAEKRAAAPQSMTAVDDMNTYAKFAQAHVDGLKNLTASFQTLYDSMPDAQKKIADQVFQDSGRQASRS